MKKIILFCIAIVSVCVNFVLADGFSPQGSAYASSDDANASLYYMSVTGGVMKSTGSFIDTSSTKGKLKARLKKSLSGGVTLGVELTGDLPVSMQISGDMYRLKQPKTATTAGNFDATTVMASALYNVKFGNFCLYPGLGVGWAKYTWKPSVGTNQSNSGLAFQAIAGMGFQLNDNLALNLQYNVVSNSVKTKTSPVKLDAHKLLLHSLRLVLQYHFV